jgi:hypothetical protein
MMPSLFRRNRKQTAPDGEENTPSPVEEVEPPSRPLLVDLGSRKARYAGDAGGRWYLSCLHEPVLLELTSSGEISRQLDCPPVDRVVSPSPGGRLVALDWQHAWGRDRGRASPGDRRHARGVDVESGRELWRMEGGLAGLVGEEHALGRDSVLPGAEYCLFELSTGKRLWSTRTYEPAVASDAGHVFILEQDGTITALELESGRQVWSCEPPRELRVAGNLCRVLAPAKEGVWYAAHPADERAALVLLSSATGAQIDVHAFDGWVEQIASFRDGLLVVHESGVAFLSGGQVRELRELVTNVAEVTCQAGATGLAAYARPSSTFAWSATAGEEVGRLQLLQLDNEWDQLRVTGDMATLCNASRYLRFPLGHGAEQPGPVEADLAAPRAADEQLEPAEVVFAGPSLVVVQHPDRGRFTLKIAETGLERGAAVQLGGFVAGPGEAATVLEYENPAGEVIRATTGPASDIQPTASGTVVIGQPRQPRQPRAPGVPAAIEQLAATLAAFELIPAISRARLARVSRRLFPAGEVAGCAAACLLQELNQDDGGLSRGFIAHDWRFGQETDDVVAELARCLPDEPVTFSQTGSEPDALRIRVSRGGEATETWVDLEDGGLDAVVDFLNGQLARAGARRRIFALETDGDWHAYIVRTPEEIAQMKERGLSGVRGADR